MVNRKIELGELTFRSANGIAVYLHVPLSGVDRSPLIALERDHSVALVHRDLPLDTSTSVADVSLAVLHLERPADSPPELSRGHVTRAWLNKLDGRTEVSFIADAHLVAVARSTQFPIAAIAALPTAYLQQRVNGIALRLVPAGVLTGLVVAVAIIQLARSRRTLAAALREGLRHNEFYLEFQPIVVLDTGDWVGVEALLRWRRDTGELIGPDLFIPVAEQSGIITKLTERVLELVETEAGQYLADHPEFHVALNLSAADRQSAAMVELIVKFLKRTGARPASLVVEITERGCIDVEAARDVIQALHDHGIEVAIDDFGTGYSSLSYLEALDLDLLKIDRSFIEAIGTRAPISRVVRHIIAIARTMGMRMVAEGVESQAQANFLRAANVHYAQGWLFGKPMPFRDVVAMRAAKQVPLITRATL